MWLAGLGTLVDPALYISAQITALTVICIPTSALSSSFIWPLKRDATVVQEFETTDLFLRQDIAQVVSKRWEGKSVLGGEEA